MIRKIAKPWTEVQLGFTFLSEEEEKNLPVCKPQDRQTAKPRKVNSESPDLGQTLTQMQAHLLEASLTEISAQLLPLLELCEATLTRALDVVAERETAPLFSAEEQRSLRGIGQAQWLIAEKLARRGTKPEERRVKKRTTNEAEGKGINGKMEKG